MIRAKLRCIQEVAALVTMEYYLLLRPFRSDQCQIWTQHLSARTKAFLSTHVTRQLPHHEFISGAVNTFFPPVSPSSSQEPGEDDIITGALSDSQPPGTAAANVSLS